MGLEKFISAPTMKNRSGKNKEPGERKREPSSSPPFQALIQGLGCQCPSPML